MKKILETEKLEEYKTRGDNMRGTHIKITRKFIAVFDILCLAYYFSLLLQSIIWDPGDSLGEKILYILLTVNPFTTGFFIMSVATIGTLVLLNNKILKCFMIILCFFTSLFSMVGIMGATSDAELILYIVLHTLPIVACVVILVMQLRSITIQNKNDNKECNDIDDP